MSFWPKLERVTYKDSHPKFFKCFSSIYRPWNLTIDIIKKQDVVLVDQEQIKAILIYETPIFRKMLQKINVLLRP